MPREPRAIVVVLDSVGVGELPDAADYGDEGSDTLAQHGACRRRAVDSEPRGDGHRVHDVVEGVPCAAEPTASWGRCVEASRRQGHHHRPLGDDGRDALAAVPDVPGRLPARGAWTAFSRRIGRGWLGNDAASGTEIIARARRRARRNRQGHRLHERGLGVPGRGAQGRRPLEELYASAESRARSWAATMRRARDRPAVHGPDAAPTCERTSAATTRSSRPSPRCSTSCTAPG